MSEPAEKRDPEAELIEAIAGFTHDPLGFVLFAYPWGEPGSPLADKEGPDEWQRELLGKIRDGLMTPAEAVEAARAVQEATASGHGVGKSALVAWLIEWAMSTFPDTRGVVTANTESQLRTKTWAELSKWHQLCITRHWFRLTATALFSVQSGRDKTWRIDAVPWSESNTEAFAGLHNEGKRILVIFDEASAIPDIIWETTEGALTDGNTEILWFAFGNPTRNTGRFKECFGRFRHRWGTRKVDGRNVRITNKAQLADWITDYGLDSDFVRIRVRGEFPRSSALQFVAADRVEEAKKREPSSLPTDPLVIGVDVARFGDDQTVIAFRRGRDARTIPWQTYRGQDTMAVAALVAEACRKHKPGALFVDEGGIGGGVVDRLRQLNIPVIGVNFGSSPTSPTVADTRVANKRAEMWAQAREWLKGGAIPDDHELDSDLTGLEYGFNADNAILLEKKEHMKRRGLASPDKGDALALTFAYPVGDLDEPEDPDDQHPGNYGGGGWMR